MFLSLLSLSLISLPSLNSLPSSNPSLLSLSCFLVLFLYCCIAPFSQTQYLLPWLSFFNSLISQSMSLSHFPNLLFHLFKLSFSLSSSSKATLSRKPVRYLKIFKTNFDSNFTKNSFKFKIMFRACDNKLDKKLFQLAGQTLFKGF